MRPPVKSRCLSRPTPISSLAAHTCEEVLKPCAQSHGAAARSVGSARHRQPPPRLLGAAPPRRRGPGAGRGRAGRPPRGAACCRRRQRRDRQQRIWPRVDARRSEGQVSGRGDRRVRPPAPRTSRMAPSSLAASWPTSARFFRCGQGGPRLSRRCHARRKRPPACASHLTCLPLARSLLPACPSLLTPACHPQANYIGVSPSLFSGSFACGRCVTIQCDDESCATPGNRSAQVALVADQCGERRQPMQRDQLRPARLVLNCGWPSAAPLKTAGPPPPSPSSLHCGARLLLQGGPVDLGAPLPQSHWPGAGRKPQHRGACDDVLPAGGPCLHRAGLLALPLCRRQRAEPLHSVPSTHTHPPCVQAQMSWDTTSCAPYTDGSIRMLVKEGGRWGDSRSPGLRWGPGAGRAAAGNVARAAPAGPPLWPTGWSSRSPQLHLASPRPALPLGPSAAARTSRRLRSRMPSSRSRPYKRVCGVQGGSKAEGPCRLAGR